MVDKKSSIKSIIKNTTPMPILVNVILVILFLIPPILGLLWIYNLKKNKCDCSENWMREYIYIYFCFIIFWNILIFIIRITTKNTILPIHIIIGILLFVYNIISYFIIVNYIYTLKNNIPKCECSKSLKKDIVYVWYITMIVFFIVSVLFFLSTYLIVKNNEK